MGYFNTTKKLIFSFLSLVFMVGASPALLANDPMAWLGQAYWVWCNKGPFCHMVDIGGGVKVERCDGQETISGVLSAEGVSYGSDGSKTFYLDSAISVSASGGGLPSVNRTTRFTGSIYQAPSSYQNGYNAIRHISVTSSRNDKLMSFSMWGTYFQRVTEVKVGERSSSVSRNEAQCSIYDYTTGSYI